jgi:hypothetical protein
VLREERDILKKVTMPPGGTTAGMKMGVGRAKLAAAAG